MVIKVDLDCQKCRKKIKKILRKIPQIQTQIYDEKANTVTITVVCCSPEKIKQRICYKGGESVKGIEIKVPEKPKPPPEKPKEAPKAKESEKPPEKTQPPPEKPTQPKVVVFVDPPKPKAPEPAPKPAAPAPKAPESAPKPPQPAPKAAPEPVPAYPPPVSACCMECYGGHGGGPCLEGYGRSAPYFGTPAAPCYGRPVYDSWGGGGGSYTYGCQRECYVGRCDCVSEENPSGCSVM